MRRQFAVMAGLALLLTAREASACVAAPNPRLQLQAAFDAIVIVTITAAGYTERVAPDIRPWRATGRLAGITRGRPDAALFEFESSGDSAACELVRPAPRVGEAWVLYLNRRDGRLAVIRSFSLSLSRFFDPRFRNGAARDMGSPAGGLIRTRNGAFALADRLEFSGLVYPRLSGAELRRTITGATLASLETFTSGDDDWRYDVNGRTYWNYGHRGRANVGSYRVAHDRVCHRLDGAERCEAFYRSAGGDFLRIIVAPPARPGNEPAPDRIALTPGAVRNPWGSHDQALSGERPFPIIGPGRD